MLHLTSRSTATLALLLTSALSTPRLAADPGPLPPKTALDDYIAKADPSYSWKLVRSTPDKGFTTHVIDMTSQGWLDPGRVDRVLWQHWLTVVRPDAPRTDVVFLMIAGGANGGEPPDKVDGRTLAIAAATGAVVAELRMVPNQPLVFDGDGQRRKEDDLIGYAWSRFLKTGDSQWLPRLPMVKSAVRAMDTIQAFLKSDKGGKLDAKRFVVAGGSKRGWTTWLTGLDRRVAAIVPIVIDVLNVKPSMEHHYAAYGFWAPAIGDYVHHRIVDQRNHPRYQALLEIEDPFFYRHRLTEPKLIINASGDQFFLPDSSQFYFEQLQGEKYLRYVPNADHSLKGSDAAESIAAFFLAIATGAPRPKFSWTFEKDGSIRVEAVDRPLETRLWQATNPAARDFRLETLGPVWTSKVLDVGGGGYLGRVEKPEKGWTAFFVELTYKGVSREPLKLTTAVRVLPDVLPYVDKLKDLDRASASE